jgi:ethanolamine utilization protein EutN
MIVARVTGEVVATVKHGDLSTAKLLLVRPVSPKGELLGRAVIAVDAVDAGVGDVVLVLDEGNAAAQVLNRPRGAIRTVVVGVIDAWEAGEWPRV